MRARRLGSRLRYVVRLRSAGFRAANLVGVHRPLNLTPLLRRNRTQTLDCSVAFFLMITYFQLMRPYCMPELRRRARELATFIWHPHQRRDDADPCAAASTSGPTAPRAMPAHATPAYATPACHPPRDTRCRPRRVSHHPSLLARQKQRLATYSTIKVCGASPHTLHTHTPHTPHIHHTSRCLPWPASPRLVQIRVRPPLGYGHP